MAPGVPNHPARGERWYSFHARTSVIIHRVTDDTVHAGWEGFPTSLQCPLDNWHEWFRRPEDMPAVKHF